MAVISNLYPPIVNDVQPAFVRTGNCNIYFALSSFNSLTDIKHVQVTLINQKTNQTAFKSSYPLGIKFISSISTVQNPTDDYKYYITINATDLIGDIFGLNTFYKVQIRFGDIVLPSNPDAAWLEANINHFSEWSKVCLIKGITQPHISINTLEEGNLVTFFIPPTEFVGKMYYQQSQNEEKEIQTLKSYNIIIQKNSNNNIIIKSDQIYTNQYDPNEFSYQLIYDLQKQINYTLLFNYTTINLYKNTVSFPFKIAETAENELYATIDITPEEDRGRMKINISFGEANTNKNLIIKRTSSKTNFLQWDDIKTIVHNENIQHLWYDTSIESGVWYKYRVQEDAENAKMSNIESPIMCVFEDIFLTQNDAQLKIQFNPEVSDLRYNVNESQQVTLGAQYPYVKRNGNNYYRSFSIGGLISALSDEENWYDPNYDANYNYFYHKNVTEPFTTPEQLYGENAAILYNNYNNTNNISQYQNYIYQREFRQKVMDFLYKNNIKLFRSLTQGNMLVKLTNISLSPISALSRMLYSFSASAIEIDEQNIQNLNTYNLINKFYYTYAKLTITDTFENEKSLINRFYQELPILQRKLTDITQLSITYRGVENNPIIYAKPKNNKIFLRHTFNNKSLILKYSDSEPIAECYFYGIHLNDEDFTETNEYYSSTNDVVNPINNGIYYINKDYISVINNYVTYYSDAGILATYPGENALLGQTYYKMIYYNNNWYPFSENQDVMIDNFNAVIEYLYRVKKED